jgi:NTE family protein
MRFSFLQEYFDLLCSDLSSFPISSAGTASSAVPILFNPVVVRNYSGCTSPLDSWVETIPARITYSNRLTTTVDNLKTYGLKEQRPYIHLIDGGVTDNLGLLAMYEMIEIAGGAPSFLNTLGVKPAKNMIFISVNASTAPQYNIEKSDEIPPIESTLNAVSDIQLHRYNDATLQLFKDSIKRWSDDVSTDAHTVTPYFIEIDFKSIQHKDRRLFFNQIPSSLSLTQDQIDNLIQVGHELLLNNAEFKKFLDASLKN